MLEIYFSMLPAISYGVTTGKQIGVHGLIGNDKAAGCGVAKITSTILRVGEMAAA
jgi:hypothetical protein